MMRRKRWTILLLCIALLETATATALCTLIQKQIMALEKTFDNTVISCVMTNAEGLNQDNLRMPSGFVDMMLGYKHDQGYYQDEYVKNVRAMARVKLTSPQDFTMVCILTPDSDHSLTVASGGSMTLFDGWDDSVFLSGQEVCVVPQGYARDGDYLEISTGSFAVKLRIIGTHTGQERCFYCPFYTLGLRDGISYMISVDSCSFDIKDARRLDEAKESLYGIFAKPDINDKSTSRPAYGVRINDEIFQSSLGEIKGNIRMLRLIFPVMLVFGGAIGFFASFLSTQGRMREYAVMRCLGMTRGRIFSLTFYEHFALALAGGALGTLFGIGASGMVTWHMLLYGVCGMATFLIGTSLSVSRITRINVMKLMKTEE